MTHLITLRRRALDNDVNHLFVGGVAKSFRDGVCYGLESLLAALGYIAKKNWQVLLVVIIVVVISNRDGEGSHACYSGELLFPISPGIT
jgi:hypothetical protein